MTWTDEALVTPRTRVRPATDADRDAYLRMVTDPHVRRYLGGPVEEEAVAELREASLGERWGGWVVADRDTDAALGSITLERHDDGQLEVSYQLLPEHWGEGLASEAVGVVLDWLVETTDDTDVVAITQEANAPSRALLGRLGFVEEASFMQYGEPQVRARRPLREGRD